MPRSPSVTAALGALCTLVALAGVALAEPASTATAPAEYPLRRHGAIVAPEGQRYLAHADGTPFLWIGDTAWNTAYRSTMEQWKHYINTRAAQGFNVVQVHATHSKGVSDRANAAGEAPFDAAGKPNPVYWRDLQQKVRYANERGVLVLLVGVGVPQQEIYIKPMLSREFAQYLAELFADDHVVFSPSMDRPHDPRNDEMARWLKKAAPGKLVTQHPNNTLPPAQAYHRDRALDFTMYQSGHAGGKTDGAYKAAFEYPAALLAEKPVRPLINGEAMYDGTGSDQGQSWSGKHARQLGWISMLRGSAGYTYGAGETRLGGRGGVWKLHADEKAFDHWKTALTWPSAAQVGHMARFFRELPWWRLVPAPQLILNQPAAVQARMAAAMTDDASLLVAFVPSGEAIELDLSKKPGERTVRWFNPINGTWRGSATAIPGGSRALLKTPGPGEWALRVQRAGE